MVNSIFIYMTVIDGVFCTGRACDIQTQDMFWSSRLTDVRLWVVITLQTVWCEIGGRHRSWNKLYVVCTVDRAASSIYQYMICKRLIEHETLPPMLIRNVVPLCMAQYDKLFSTTRFRCYCYQAESLFAAQAIPPIPTRFSIAWSVCPSSVYHLSHLCTLLGPFNGFKCHLAGTLVGSNDTFCHMGSLTPRGRVDLGVEALAKTCSCFWLTKKRWSMIHQVAASISYSAFYQITLVFVIIIIVTRINFKMPKMSRKTARTRNKCRVKVWGMQHQSECLWTKTRLQKTSCERFSSEVLFELTHGLKQ